MFSLVHVRPCCYAVVVYNMLILWRAAARFFIANVVHMFWYKIMCVLRVGSKVLTILARVMCCGGLQLI